MLLDHIAEKLAGLIEDLRLEAIDNGALAT
jgi:hypothetical protein